MNASRFKLPPCLPDYTEYATDLASHRVAATLKTGIIACDARNAACVARVLRASQHCPIYHTRLVTQSDSDMDFSNLKRRLIPVTFATGAVVALLSSTATYACPCTKPQPPDIPADVFVQTMPVGEITAKQSDVKDYIVEVADYQQCLVDCIKDVNYELTDISVEAERVVADWKRVVNLRDPQ